jgi:hypothetical protein
LEILAIPTGIAAVSALPGPKIHGDFSCHVFVGHHT